MTDTGSGPPPDGAPSDADYVDTSYKVGILKTNGHVIVAVEGLTHDMAFAPSAAIAFAMEILDAARISLLEFSSERH